MEKATIHFKTGAPTSVTAIGFPLVVDVVFDTTVAEANAFTKDARIIDHIDIETEAQTPEQRPQIDILRKNPNSSLFHLDIAKATLTVGTDLEKNDYTSPGVIEKTPSAPGESVASVISVHFGPPTRKNDQTTWEFSYSVPTRTLIVKVKRVGP